MKKVNIDKKTFVDSLMSLSTFDVDKLDKFTNLKFNNDLVFYKRLLGKGITHFEGGAREGFELTWDIHMEIYEEGQHRKLSEDERQMLDTFFDTIDNMELLFDQDEETGDE